MLGSAYRDYSLMATVKFAAVHLMYIKRNMGRNSEGFGAKDSFLT